MYSGKWKLSTVQGVKPCVKCKVVESLSVKWQTMLPTENWSNIYISFVYINLVIHTKVNLYFLMFFATLYRIVFFQMKMKSQRCEKLTWAASGVICVNLWLLYVRSKVICILYSVMCNVFCYIFNDKYVIVYSPWSMHSYLCGFTCVHPCRSRSILS